ncbi:MAG: 50S ribosomal protein L32 [Candidatus Omnitrophica bacterium]|nr:50S ribosomal protein L32 [Candidatus Omnitrophota bacterium]
MALPKRRHSKTRRDKSRTHHGLIPPQLAPCKQCGALRLPHRVCPQCGTYRGRQVIKMGSAE